MSEHPTELPADVRALFDAYRDAFDRLRGDEIARLYAVPSGILSGRVYVHWPDAESVAANMTALCRQYREHGYRAAHYQVAWAAPLGPDAFVADIAWRLDRNDAQ